MARYKHYDYGQMKLLPVSFDRQILSPGVKDEVGVSFIVKRKPGQLIVFLVEGSSKTDSGEKKDWFDHRWDYVCREGPAVSKRK